MKRIWPPLAILLLVTLGAPGIATAQQVSCDSTDYQQQFCPTAPIARAWLVAQRSRSLCIEGQTWGYQSNGIWVNQGCQGDFAFVVGSGPPPVTPGGSGSIRILCESRNYQQQFCATGRQITGVWVINQQSSAPCIQGRTFGYQNNDVWVTQGCAAEFGVQGYSTPAYAPPRAGNLVCESRNYTQNYCPVGQYFSRAWLVAQRSHSPCQQGRTWGYDRNGIWVTQGCEAEFAFE